MVQLIPKIDAQLIDQPASNVTELVIIHLNAGPPIAILILPKIKGNLTGFLVEAEHLMVKDTLQDRSMKQLRSLKPSLMTNLT